MADTGVGITPGSGADIAVNVVGSLKMQRVKIDMGGDGLSVPLVGDVTYGLPVDIKRFPAGAVTVNNPTAANLKVDPSGVTSPISDAGGSLTVDAPAATPVAVRLSTGSAFIDTIPVSGTVTANQGTPASAANRWKVGINDGTTEATVDSGTAALKVYIAGGSAGGGTSLADKATFTDGTTVATPISGVYNDAATDPSAGHAAALRMTVKRGLHINLRDATGVELGSNANPVRVDPTGSTVQPVSGTVTAKLKDDTGTAYGPTNPLYVVTGGRAQTRMSKSVALIASQTLQPVWTPAAGKKFYVRKIVLNVTTAGPLKFLDSTATSARTLADSGAGVNWPVGLYNIDFAEPWASDTADNVLNYTSGSALVGQATTYGYEA